MTQVLRQSTQVIVVIGPFVDVTDAFTPETGVTLSGADEAELLKANTTTTTDISGATWAAITGCDGWYGLTLTTSHTDTVGALTVMVNDDSVCLPVFARFQVIEEAAYDAMYAASAAPKTGINVSSIDANVITATAIADGAIDAATLATGTITAAKFAAGAIDAAAIATGAIDADALAADAGTEIATAVWASGTRSLTVLDEDSTTLDLDATIRAAVGMASANLDTQLTAIDDYLDTEIAAILAAVDTEVAAILADTNELQTDWANGGRLDNILDARASQTSVDTVDTIVDAILDDTGTAGVALSAAAVDAILDDVVEGSTTVRQLLRGFAAALLGKASGLDTTTAVFRNIGDSKDRITATVDADGNRTAVTLDLT